MMKNWILEISTKLTLTSNLDIIKERMNSNKSTSSILKLFPLLTITLLTINAQRVFAQQIPMYAGYTVNNFLLSPSFAGTDNSDTRLMALNRLQFAGLEGAPVTFMFTGDGPIKKKNMGLGATIYTDKYGLLRQTGVGLGYSYNISLGDETKLYFGLGAQLGQLSLDFDNIVAKDMTDELLNLSSASKLLVNGSFGMHLTHKDFTLGYINTNNIITLLVNDCIKSY